MPSSTQIQSFPIDEYLEGEKHSEIRHEYINGEVFAMVGSSNVHNLIAVALLSAIRPKLKAPCHVYMSDMKVRVQDNFYYPDLVVSCEATADLTYYLSEPKIIIEVLSASTEGRDRVEKSIAYRSLSSLQEYVLVSQDKILVEVIRMKDQGWETVRYESGDQVQLDAINMTFPADTIYEDVAKFLGKTP